MHSDNHTSLDIRCDNSYLITEIRESDVMVILILDFGHHVGMAVNDFFTHSGLHEASKIIICDASRRKTLGGIQPELPTFEHLVKHLRLILSRHPHKKVYVTGSSGGGHPAILLGHLLKADQVVAFCPYPYISKAKLLEMKDHARVSMGRVLEKIHDLPSEIHAYFDLGDVLADWNGVTEYHVHVSKFNIREYNRSSYLCGLPKMNVIAHPFNSHAVVLLLHKHFDLKDCFIFPYKKRHKFKRIALYLKHRKERLLKSRDSKDKKRLS